jgi:hypothetical protein
MILTASPVTASHLQNLTHTTPSARKTCRSARARSSWWVIPQDSTKSQSLYKVKQSEITSCRRPQRSRLWWCLMEVGGPGTETARRPEPAQECPCEAHQSRSGRGDQRPPYSRQRIARPGAPEAGLRRRVVQEPLPVLLHG